MTANSFPILSGRSDQGFVAASVTSPYFCFVEKSEADAIRKAQSAVDFYDRNASRLPASERRTISFSTLSATRNVNLEHLAVA